MLEIFYPDDYMDSVYDLPFAKYYASGIRGVIFDIDNTLVPHGAPADERIKDLFAGLRQIGMKTCLMSNNKEPRVASFARQVESDYIYKAGKPRTKNYFNAMRRMGTERSSTIFVGDQLFTDILGAKHAGIQNVLLKPIDPREEIQIVIKRRLEAFVLYHYKRYCDKEKAL